jgi:hypothetical protein
MRVSSAKLRKDAGMTTEPAAAGALQLTDAKLQGWTRRNSAASFIARLSLFG